MEKIQIKKTGTAFSWSVTICTFISYPKLHPISSFKTEHTSFICDITWFLTDITFTSF